MLVLGDAEVATLVPPAAAVAAVESALRRLAPEAASGPRTDLVLKGERFGADSAVDLELGLAWVGVIGRSGGTALLLETEELRPAAVVETGALAALAAGATSAVAASRLTRSGARTVGLIGCGRLAAAHLACLRATLPTVERAVVWCRSAERLSAFCRMHDAAPADYGTDAASLDVVVTATGSRDPVLRGDWLQPGAFVCASGAVMPQDRELDNVVLQRASFVCCDSLEEARRRAGDLIEPVERGVLDWLEVHELGEVVAGGVEGRQSESDIVVLKSIGSPGLRLAVAATALERTP